MNDERLYAGMRASFEAAGFHDFMALREGEPFSEITRLGSEDGGPVVLCHQDVRLDQGHGASDLESRLKDLGALDPAWVVAGNAGARWAWSIENIADPHGSRFRDDLPHRVTTLDENFLVLNTHNQPRCTPGLSGFHLYGSDVCLNAKRHCYVIDFRLTHLSPGDITGFGEALETFRLARARSVPRYVNTNVVFTTIGRPAWAVRVMDHPHVKYRVYRTARRLRRI